MSFEGGKHGKVESIPLVTRRHVQLTKSLFRHRLAVLGMGILMLLVLTATLAPVIAPYDPVAPDYSDTLQSPSVDHPFGTDSFGRDVFSRIVHGTRISIYVGLMIVFFSIAIGVPTGLFAGFYANSLVDTLLMRVMDALLSFPSIILALTIMAALGGSLNNVIIALTIVNIPIFARLVRGSVLSIKEEEYITSAEAVGSPTWKIVFVHILPNAIAPIIVQGTLVFAFSILNEATLSFLGIGTQPPTPSWGLMLREGKQFIGDSIWLSFFPGLSIMITVLSLNFMGDALRDTLDPKHSEETMK